jgi:hypothetical protein
MKNEPSVTASIAKYVAIVAAWVRFINADQNSPTQHKPNAVVRRTT